MTKNRLIFAFLALAATGSAMPASAQSAGSRYDFFQAVRNNESATVQRMIDTPGSLIVNARDTSENGETALLIKTRNRELNWMSYLLGKGADPDLADKDGEAPLHIAAQLNFIEGAKLLLNSDAAIDIRTRSGETPLIRAVRLRHSDMVKLLLRRGANPDLTDNATGRSARDYARDDPRGGAMIAAIEQIEQEKKNEAAEKDDQGPRDPFDFSGDFFPVD